MPWNTFGPVSWCVWRRADRDQTDSSRGQDYLIGPEPPRYNEQALKNLVDDVLFIEREVKRLEKPGLDNVFEEIKAVSSDGRVGRSLR